MPRPAVLLAVLLLAGCGGGAAKPDHATLTAVDVHESSIDFTFDVAPDEVGAVEATRPSLAECGSGRPVRPQGSAFVVVHFRPAQTQGLPKRIVMPSGLVRDVWKVCDFEADVGWAVGLSQRAQAHVSRDGTTVTVTFGG